MERISLRKLKIADKKYFSKWWRDKNLLKLTSGILKPISDKEVDKYFLLMINNKFSQNFMIMFNQNIIGHTALAKRKGGWYETQIVIGDKKCWGKGYGTKAIQLLLKNAKKSGISKIYLEVRPTNIRAIRAYENSGFVKIGFKKYPKNKYLSETLKMKIV